MRPSQGRDAGPIPTTRLSNLPPPKALKGHLGGPAPMPAALGGQGLRHGFDSRYPLADVAQWQSNRFVSDRLSVQVRPSAQILIFDKNFKMVYSQANLALDCCLTKEGENV